MDNTTVINPNKQTLDTGTTQRTRIHEIEKEKKMVITIFKHKTRSL